MQKGFKKIWFTFLLTVGVLAIIVVGRTVKDYLEFHNWIYGDGITPENWEEVQIADKVMTEWKQEGIEEAVDWMEPVELYFRLSKPVSYEEINQWAGQWFVEEAPVYRKFEVAGESFSELIYGEGEELLPWETPPNYPTPLTETGYEMKKALDAGDTMNFWYLMMKEYQFQVIVTETIYEGVTARYDDINTEYYHKLELESGNYYYYNEVDENGNTNIGFSDFGKDMYEKLESLSSPGEGFFICAQSRYMPEELSREFIKSYKKVQESFEEYAVYYQKLGYYEFADIWRETVAAAWKTKKAGEIALENYEIERIFQPDNEDYYGFRVMCRADFNNGYSLYLYFDINNGRCALDDIRADYKEGMSEEEKKELEEFREKIYGSLDYRVQVPG